MKKMLLYLIVLAMLLSGCSQEVVEPDTGISGESAVAESSLSEELAESTQNQDETVTGNETTDNNNSESSTNQNETTTGNEIATDNEIAEIADINNWETLLYVGIDGHFNEYPLEFTGELTPDVLIRGLSDLTGWNIILSENISTGSGGMTVCLSRKSGIFGNGFDATRPEFERMDVDSYVFSVLDSIRKTLQHNYVDPGLGDPSSLDIYFCAEGSEPISIPYMGASGWAWPLDKPFPGSAAIDSY